MQYICCIEGPVFEIKKTLEFFFFVTDNKLIGTVSHQFDQFIAFVDDSSTVTPSKNRSKKTGEIADEEGSEESGEAPCKENH